MTTRSYFVDSAFNYVLVVLVVLAGASDVIFFVLRNPKAGSGNAVTDFVPIDGAQTGDAPRCEVCGKYVGMRPLLPPIRIELDAWGSSWGDVVFGPGDQLLISQRLKEVFVEAGLSGFTSLSPTAIVKFRRRRKSLGGNPPDYWLASIVRSEAMLDEGASGLERDTGEVCSTCGLGGIIERVRRVALQPDTWSGEDIFFARGLPGTILTSRRFAALCEAVGIANCSLVGADTFGFDDYPQVLR